MGVSCNADRNIKAKITRDGIFLERLENNPAKYLPGPAAAAEPAVAIDLNRPMSEIRATLSKYPVATRLVLDGPIIVARDIAHARLKEKVDKGEDLPAYFKDHIIYYAGPAKTPPGYASGSLGADHGRPHGRLRRPLPEDGRVRWSCWPRATAPRP